MIIGAELAGMEAIREAAREGGAAVIDAYIELEGPFPSVQLDLEEFTAALKALRPRVLYLSNLTFHAEEMAQDAVPAQGSFRPDSPPPPYRESEEFKAIIARWQARDGQPCSFSTAFMGDGVLHRCTKTFQEWFGAFLAELDAFFERFAGDEEQRRTAARKASTKHLALQATQLMRHPHFAAPRSSKAKRKYLARELFPELSDTTLDAVVEEAEIRLWRETKPDY